MESFEKSLKNKMEQASLGELMPGFDAEQEWEGLEQRLQPRSRRRFALVWSHAAAILVGVLACWFVVKETTQKQTGADKGVVNVPGAMQPQLPPAIPLPQGGADSLKNETVATREAKRITPGLAKKKKGNAKGTAAGAPQSVAAINEPAIYRPIYADSGLLFDSMPVARNPVAAVKKTRPKAINMLDIDNEDRQFIINEQPAGRRVPQIVTQFQYLRTMPDAVAANYDNPYIIRTIFSKR